MNDMKHIAVAAMGGVALLAVSAAAAAALTGAARMEAGTSVIATHGCHRFCYRTSPRDPGHFHKGSGSNCVRLSCLPRPQRPRR